MRIYGIRFTLIAALFALTFALTLATWSGSANQTPNPQKASKQDTKPEDDLPILDFKHAETTTEADQEQGPPDPFRMYRKIAELPKGVEPLPTTAHDLLQLPAIPAKQSDAIILGTVTDRRAVLTDDRTRIYSEFSISIAEIFKDDPHLFRVGQAVTVSRRGGAVRFPSGKIQRYTFYNQNYPRQGKVYILFLRREEENDFSILTGYEVDGAVIQPLDGKRGSTNKEDRIQFDVYRGVRQEAFISELQKALQKTGGGPN